MTGGKQTKVRVSVDAALVDELLALSEDEDRNEAVARAIQEYLRRKKLTKTSEQLPGDIDTQEGATRKQHILKMTDEIMDTHHETFKKLAE